MVWYSSLVPGSCAILRPITELLFIRKSRARVVRLISSRCRGVQSGQSCRPYLQAMLAAGTAMVRRSSTPASTLWGSVGRAHSRWRRPHDHMERLSSARSGSEHQSEAHNDSRRPRRGRHVLLRLLASAGTRRADARGPTAFEGPRDGSEGTLQGSARGCAKRADHRPP